MEQRIILDRIEVNINPETGEISAGFRLQKQLVNGDKVVFTEPHRSMVGPGVSHTDKVDEVNKHLAEMGWPGIDPDDTAHLGLHVSKAREVMAARKAKKPK